MCFTFLNDQNILECLKSEFPQYVAKVANTLPDIDMDGCLITVKISQIGH